MGFSRQEYWSGLPLPSPGDLPEPEIKPQSPALQADVVPSEPAGKPFLVNTGVPVKEGNSFAWVSGTCPQEARSCFLFESTTGVLLGPSSYAHPRGAGILTGSPKRYLNIPFLRLFLWWGWRVWSQSGFFHPAPTGDFELSWPHSRVPCLGSCCLSGAYLSLSVVFPFDGRDFMQLQDIRYRVRLLLLWKLEFLMRVLVGFGGKSDGMRIRVLRFWNCSKCFQVPWITYGNCGSLILALVYA